MTRMDPGICISTYKSLKRIKFKLFRLILSRIVLPVTILTVECKIRYTLSYCSTKYLILDSGGDFHFSVLKDSNLNIPVPQKTTQILMKRSQRIPWENNNLWIKQILPHVEFETTILHSAVQSGEVIVSATTPTVQ